MLGVFAPAPTSMATLPLVGGVPLTLATITTAIYVVSYVMMDPVAGGLGALLMLVLNQEPPWQDCLSGKQFLPSMLPPGLHSSLVTASLKCYSSLAIGTPFTENA